MGSLGERNEGIFTLEDQNGFQKGFWTSHDIYFFKKNSAWCIVDGEIESPVPLFKKIAVGFAIRCAFFPIFGVACLPQITSEMSHSEHGAGIGYNSTQILDIRGT